MVRVVSSGQMFARRQNLVGTMVPVRNTPVVDTCRHEFHADVRHRKSKTGTRFRFVSVRRRPGPIDTFPPTFAEQTPATILGVVDTRRLPPAIGTYRSARVRSAFLTSRFVQGGPTTMNRTARSPDRKTFGTFADLGAGVDVCVCVCNALVRTSRRRHFSLTGHTARMVYAVDDRRLFYRDRIK